MLIYLKPKPELFSSLQMSGKFLLDWTTPNMICTGRPPCGYSVSFLELLKNANPNYLKKIHADRLVRLLDMPDTLEQLKRCSCKQSIQTLRKLGWTYTLANGERASF